MLAKGPAKKKETLEVSKEKIKTNIFDADSEEEKDQSGKGRRGSAMPTLGFDAMLTKPKLSQARRPSQRYKMSNFDSDSD